MTTIVSLGIEAAAQARLDALRRQHYPPALNQIAAHLTLFHTLPLSDDITDALLEETTACPAFQVQVTGVMGMGRGVALRCASDELTALHGRLAGRFAQHLSAQDRQGFRPHIVVQNKVSPDAARTVQSELEAAFEPWELRPSRFCGGTILGARGA